MVQANCCLVFIAWIAADILSGRHQNQKPCLVFYYHATLQAFIKAEDRLMSGT